MPTLLTPRDRIEALQRELAEAPDYSTWRQIAEALDELEGNDAWREDPISPHYDHALIQEHLRQLRAARGARDFRSLRDLLEESLHRNLGDLSNQALYEYSYVGTKALIEEYLDEVESTLYWLRDEPLPGWPDERKLAMAREALRVFGRSALILSGGGSLGLFHMGVVKALFEQELLPEVISGASMGAIVAGGAAVRDDEELARMWEDLGQIHRRAVRFQGPRRWLRTGSLLAPEQLREHVEANLADMTFAQAYAHSGRVLNVAVSPTRRRQKPRLLNHLTTPEVLIPDAAIASCSLPALFPPCELRRRGEDGRARPFITGERWVDGSLHGDVPTMRLGRLHNVNHHIVSQANPHVLPIAKLEGSAGMIPTVVDLATGGLRAQGRQLLNLARRRLGRSLWRPPLEWAHAMAHQNYTGDINIHPRLRLTDYTRVMKNPSLRELEAYILSGERATWPRASMIRDQTRLSRAMQRCIRDLERRIQAP